MYRRFPRFFYVFIIVCIVVVLSSAALVARAQQNEFFPVTAIEVISVFYKLAGLEPNFELWAKNSETYNAAPDFDKEIVKRQEMRRIQEAYYNVFPDEMMTIHVRLRLNDYSDLQEAYFVPEFSSNTYFAYSIFNQYFALIPSNIDEFHRLDIPRDQAKMIKARSRRGNLLELRVMPVEADTRGTVRIGRHDRWLLLVKIADLRLWDLQQNTIYWSKTAAWYEEEMGDNAELLDLYAQ